MKNISCCFQDNSLSRQLDKLSDHLVMEDDDETVLSSTIEFERWYHYSSTTIAIPLLFSCWRLSKLMQYWTTNFQAPKTLELYIDAKPPCTNINQTLCAIITYSNCLMKRVVLDTISKLHRPIVKRLDQRKSI